MSSSVRFPNARAKNAPAMSGDGRTNVKYRAAVSPNSARPRAICQAPPIPKLHQVHVPKTGNSASKIRRASGLGLRLEYSGPNAFASSKKKKKQNPGIRADTQ